MRLMHVTLALAAAAGATLPAARGADWPKIDGMKFSHRLAVSVENPADVPTAAALVHLPLADLGKVLPDVDPGQVVVIDPASPVPKRDEADKYFVPFQTDGGNLVFSIPLAAHEKRQLYVYTAAAALNLPAFPPGTAYDARHAYRSFENNYSAFRFESGAGANTTGMAIDLFGKTAAGKGLRLVELYQQGHDAYHELQYWGVDILKVGTGPGLGGVYVVAGDKTGRAEFLTTVIECAYAGPVETRLRITAPVEVAGKKYDVVRTLTIVAEDRSLRDEVSVRGDDLSGVQIGLGLRDLPNCTWTEKPDRGYAYMTGDANQLHYKAVGLGAAFDPAAFVKMSELPDKANAGHVYVLKGTTENGLLVSRHRLAGVWDADGQLPKPAEKADELKPTFEQWFENWAAERDHPVKVDVGTAAETPG